MRTAILPSATLLLLLAAPPAVAGQSRAQPTPDPAGVPREMRPPAGKCRIWVQGVPAAQQPAATDCATALRQKPANGTIVYGPAAPRRGLVGFEATPADRERDRLAASRARAAGSGSARSPASRDSTASRSGTPTAGARAIRRDTTRAVRRTASPPPPDPKKKKPENP